MGGYIIHYILIKIRLRDQIGNNMNPDNTVKRLGRNHTSICIIIYILKIHLKVPQHICYVPVPLLGAGNERSTFLLLGYCGVKSISRKKGRTDRFRYFSLLLLFLF